MICKNCNNEMILDDVDINTNGSRDKYWICAKCNIGCIEEIRVHKDNCVIWQED